MVATRHNLAPVAIVYVEDFQGIEEATNNEDQLATIPG